MSPRPPAALREAGSQNVRDYLISTAARLMAERGTAGLSVRDIARAAGVADGVLYNYFDDKDDLLAHALCDYVASVMASAPAMLPPPGSSTVTANLQTFIEHGIATLERITPAFAGLLSQPGVLTRFHALAGHSIASGLGTAEGGAGEGDQEAAHASGRGFGDLLQEYLRAEQRLGRLAVEADTGAAAALIVGAIHGQVLPRAVFTAPAGGAAPPTEPAPTAHSELAHRLATTLLRGIAP
ncbi:MAG TPA: helix-turn-helix domain-containing protein [Streptosporangiaceae bacterium]|nr:helix-turn-helix domain-containing protein [Streptosporangiaceae bacterium]